VLAVVRLRPRTGDRDFGPQVIVLLALFSVGEFGGPDSLFIRAKVKSTLRDPYR
jgi:hypothetical protein